MVSHANQKEKHLPWVSWEIRVKARNNIGQMKTEYMVKGNGRTSSQVGR